MTTYGYVRIGLRTPILFPSNRPWEGIKLDGLLGALWASDHNLQKSPAEEDPANIQFPELPFIQIAPQVYGASAMFLPDEAEMEEQHFHVFTVPDTIIKSTDWDKPMRAQIRKGLSDFNLETSSGRYRGAMETYWALYSPYIDFYFATDDYPALTKYLDRIQTECHGIGAKRHIGYGSIYSVTYDTLDKEDCFYFELDGLPTRPLPVKYFEGQFPDSCKGYTSYKNPYSSPYTKELCYMPPYGQYLPQNLSFNQEFENALEIECKEQQELFQNLQKKNKKKNA